MNNRIAFEIDQGAVNQQRAWARNAAFPISTASMLLTMSTIASCTIIPQTHTIVGQGSRPSSREDLDGTRDFDIHPRLGSDYSPQVNRSKNDVPRKPHDGDTVATGDPIRTSIQSSKNAHLYLALCAHQELAVYPSQSGIQIRAGELVIVPQAGAELVVGDHPGPQVLYVIVSRTEIAIADPRLAHELAAKGPGDPPMNCGTNLDATLAKPPSPPGPARPRIPGSPNVIDGESRKRDRPSKDPTTIAPRAGSASSVTNRDPVQTVPPPSSGNEPRIPEFELK